MEGQKPRQMRGVSAPILGEKGPGEDRSRPGRDGRMKAANREKILAALLTCSTKKEAATVAGVGVRTIYEYLRDPDFMAEYTEAKRNLIRDASDKIKQSLGPAIDALHTIATDPKAGKTARVQAARTLIEYAIELDKHTGIEDRIAALEAGRADNA